MVNSKSIYALDVYSRRLRAAYAAIFLIRSRAHPPEG